MYDILGIELAIGQTIVYILHDRLIIATILELDGNVIGIKKAGMNRVGRFIFRPDTVLVLTRQPEYAKI